MKVLVWETYEMFCFNALCKVTKSDNNNEAWKVHLNVGFQISFQLELLNPKVIRQHLYPL
jgi:hypothetical protein